MEQRPYLFRFFHNRPVTGDIEAMQQSCAFLPVKSEQDEVEHVCITIFDYTDTALYRAKREGRNRVVAVEESLTLS